MLMTIEGHRLMKLAYFVMVVAVIATLLAFPGYERILNPALEHFINSTLTIL